MRLHQLKIEFVAEHDRLLMRLATDSGSEVLVWLTRRCVKRLWPLLLSMAQTTPDIALQQNPEAKRALLGFQHEKAVRQADFSKPYEDAQRERPLGQNPLLITRIQPRRDPQGRHVLGLLPTGRAGRSHHPRRQSPARRRQVDPERRGARRLGPRAAGAHGPGAGRARGKRPPDDQLTRAGRRAVRRSIAARACQLVASSSACTRSHSLSVFSKASAQRARSRSADATSSGSPCA